MSFKEFYARGGEVVRNHRWELFEKIDLPDGAHTEIYKCACGMSRIKAVSAPRDRFGYRERKVSFADANGVSCKAGVCPVTNPIR
jgi:hypothetical protein